jgi:hypothetical protein
MEPLIRMLSYHPNGTRKFYVYDKDHYEPKNNVRQLFDPQYCGMNKALAAEERYKSICDITGIPEYVKRREFGGMISNVYDSYNDGAVLIILAVDNERTRHEVIKDLDELNPRIDFACVLPGNEYNTASCVWYNRVKGMLKPIHPFEVVTNFAVPTDQHPGSCGYEAVSSPQLINANFASALITCEVVYALLEDKNLPFRVNYSSTELNMYTEGRFLPVQALI